MTPSDTACRFPGSFQMRPLAPGEERRDLFCPQCDAEQCIFEADGCSPAEHVARLRWGRDHDIPFPTLAERGGEKERRASPDLTGKLRAVHEVLMDAGSEGIGSREVAARLGQAKSSTWAWLNTLMGIGLAVNIGHAATSRWHGVEGDVPGAGKGDDDGLGEREKVVLDFVREHGETTVHEAHARAHLGLSREGIRYRFGKLHQMGYLEKRPRAGPMGRDVYRIASSEP